MSRRTRAPVDGPTLWPLEASPQELRAAVSRALGQEPTPGPEWPPAEPAWVSAALRASWPRALAEAEIAQPGTWCWP